MKEFSESQRLSFMLLVSLALNLFLLPGIAGKWFWSQYSTKFSVDQLHPAEVKTVTLRPEKTTPPKPKLAPVKRIVPAPTPAPRPQSPHRTNQPHANPPRILVQGPGEGSTENRTVTQGSGQAGVPTLPSPPAQAPPKPAGETRGSIPLYQPVPQIPESLRTEVLKTFVRARFDIAADGTEQVTLLTSSGSLELDQLTLETLRQWRWKPALRNGTPVPSVERLKIEFEVE